MRLVFFYVLLQGRSSLLHTFPATTTPEDDKPKQRETKIAKVAGNEREATPVTTGGLEIQTREQQGVQMSFGKLFTKEKDRETLETSRLRNGGETNNSAEPLDRNSSGANTWTNASPCNTMPDQHEATAYHKHLQDKHQMQKTQEEGPKDQAILEQMVEERDLFAIRDSQINLDNSQDTGATKIGITASVALIYLFSFTHCLVPRSTLIIWYLGALQLFGFLEHLNYFVSWRAVTYQSE